VLRSFHLSFHLLLALTALAGHVHALFGSKGRFARRKGGFFLCAGGSISGPKCSFTPYFDSSSSYLSHFTPSLKCFAGSYSGVSTFTSEPRGRAYCLKPEGGKVMCGIEVMTMPSQRRDLRMKNGFIFFFFNAYDPISSLHSAC